MNNSDKTKEQLLQESETRYKAIFESAREGILVGIIETMQIMYANPAICKMFGYTAEELAHLTVSDIHPKEQLRYVSERFEALVQTEEAFTQNLPCLRKNGTVFYADISATRIVIDNKDCFVGFFTDTTEHKHTEDALREKSALLVKIINSVPDFIFAKDANVRTIICNEAYASAVGKKPDEMIGHTDIENGWDPELVCGNPAKGIHGFENDDRDALSGKTVHNPYDPANTPNGVLIFDTYKMPLHDKDGEIIGILGIARDITERKHTEDALRESEARYKAIFNSATEGIMVADIETKRLSYVNQAACEMFGYTAEQLQQKTVYDIHPKEYITSVIEGFKAQSRGEKTLIANVPCLSKDGTVFYANINTACVVIDNTSCMVGLFTNITERKHTEDALRESEARYKAIFESAREGILVADIETKQFKYVNPASCKMFGYSADELTRMTLNDIHRRESLAEVKRDFDAKAQGNREISRNVLCLRKNGTLFYADINTANVLIDNRPCLAGFFTDTTKHKQTEDALRESEARYKAIFNFATEGIVVTDVETKQHRYANPAFCRMFGYTAEELQQMTVYDIHPKEYIPSVIAGLEAQARGEKTLVPNVPCLHKDGTVFYANIDATSVVIDQRPCNVGLFTNITERKQAEEALRQSEEKFRGMAERSSEMIFMTDTRGFVTYLSPASERIFGYKPQEMVGKNFTNFLVKSEIPKAVKRFTEKLQGKAHGVLYLEAKKKNGSRVFIELSSSLVIQNGKPAGTQGIIKDITERKKAEEQLQKAHEELETRVKKRTSDLARAVETLQKEIAERKHAEESLRSAEVRFRTIFENTIVGLYRTTPSGRMLLANPALIKMMGCRSFKELANFDVEKNGYDPSTPRSIFKKLIKKEGKVIGLESVWRRPDGTKLFVSDSAFAVKDDKGKILYYEGTAQDITQRKEAEEKLMLYQQQLRSLASELSLAEERLRRRIAAELHDHIAQNLAISKIKLESLASDTGSGQTKSLKEVIDLISQTIDATRMLTFEMSPPILYELGFEAAVGWLARQTRQRFGLDVEFINDEKPKPLNTDIRVLLFQAVRELLVNIVKHAKAKKAKIYANAVGNNIQVTVEDDGIGFDAATLGPAKDFTKGGFGLFNIRERLDQIGGSVIIHSGHRIGTQITMTAPIEKRKKPKTRFSDTRSGKKRSAAKKVK